jgi:hypothetical protein
MVSSPAVQVALSEAEKKATNAKKKAGSKVGEHIVPNTAAASRARKGAS